VLNAEIHIFESRRFPMKTFYKFAALTLAMLAVTACAVAQDGPQVAAPLNLERGVVGPVSTSPSWSNYSAINLIPGAGLLPITSKTTAFYLGFTAGTQADVSNMVLYTTARNSSTITAVTPVTYGGASNPSINLASKAVCALPPSNGTPCIVRLDPLTLSLSALSDYYLVVFFTANDGNNGSLGAAVSGNYLSSLSGWYLQTDQTHFTVGQSIPAGSAGHPPNFLMYVMTN
jgi:hypothetical protein